MNNEQIMPFNIFLWKITSRCNLNCKYCYVYNSVDSLWRQQPVFMSGDVAKQTALRMREHCEVYGEAHGMNKVCINFHGGEPMLGGTKHLQQMISIIEETFADSGINVQLGMQSNGLLFTPEIGDLFLEKNISLGISIDGPPEVNDINRIDRRGRPTTARLEEKLALITSPHYKSIFGGFLCVINPDVDPLSVIEYLSSFNPSGIDFLLPLNNHDRRPPGKEVNINATSYADWLIKIFDYWFYSSSKIRIRLFDSIIRMICSESSLVESIGTDPVALIVVEANGSIEAVDSLKTTFEGATKLDYNIFDHDFNTVAADIAVRNRQMGANSLCKKCQECPLVDICGSGYLPHRYSTERGFDNPSVYCADLEKLIRHIYQEVAQELEKQVREEVSV